MIDERARKGRIDSLLAKPVTFQGRHMTKAQMVEEMVRLGGVLRLDRFSKYVFSRTAFNRMDYGEQKKYEEKMKIKMPFAVELPSGSFFEITKTEADYFQSIGGTEGLRENPSSAVNMFERFNHYEANDVGPFKSGFKIPTTCALVGTAVDVSYSSDKCLEGCPKRPINYIHEHDSGVKVYRTDVRGDHPVPAFIRDVKELVLLGQSLGFTYDDGEDLIEAEPTRPAPELYCIPSGKALLVIQSKKKVLALIWGGRLGVEARGIVH